MNMARRSFELRYDRDSLREDRAGVLPTPSPDAPRRLLTRLIAVGRVREMSSSFFRPTSHELTVRGCSRSGWP
jgi:hypothetical protein